MRQPSFVADLEPIALFRHFDALLGIPRPSKAEARAALYVQELAARHGLSWRADTRGNFVVDVPATLGRESAPTVVLQGHLDMVTVKDTGVTHNFDVDPIVPRRDGDWVLATGTTLGADNGLGAAAMLAWIDTAPGPHGPLELLFTVEEETGLQGVMDLDGSIVHGRVLLNLDSEEEGVITIGCAGARGSKILLPVNRTAPAAGAVALAVSVSGLVGGHSGMDIAKGRGNAIALLVRAVSAAAGGTPINLAGFTGGQSHNAIPREAHATVVLPSAAVSSFKTQFEAELVAIRAEFGAVEADLTWSCGDGELPSGVLDLASTRQLLALALALPFGVLAMSRELPGLVETSTNFAKLADGGSGPVELFLASRSSVDTALGAFCARVRALAELAGATVEETRGYPGWKPDPTSALLATTREVLREALGHEPEVGAVHAGLECGVIGAKCPGMDMVSIGPIIENPHSPHERFHVASAGRFFSALAVLLDRLSRPAVV